MGFTGFVSWFLGGMLLVAMVDVLIGNVFVTSFIAGTIMGFLGAKE